MGTHEGVPYLVSELLEGESLRGRLIPFLSRNKSLSSIQKSGYPSREPRVTQSRLNWLYLVPKRFSYFTDRGFNVLQCLPDVMGYASFHRIPERFDRIQFWTIGR